MKALTGIDADRLAEEKRRGITIDLGFAHAELAGPGGERLRFAFVDVPGHERFVRNMLAGIGGIDLVLLVIAADEGIKPQTREHFDICRLLSIRRGIVVITKADLVDSDTLDVVRLEVEDFVRGSFLESSPVVVVSSRTSSGLEQMKGELTKLAAAVDVRDSRAIARLPIDRVFTMKGFGTVVTGTLISGTIGKEDELELFPARKRVRVRGVQVHGVAADRANAGERTALNVAGIEKNDLARGMVLASPGLLQPSSRMDVKLSLLPSARALKTGVRVHLHAFSSEVIAAVQLHEGKQLSSGGESFAQLRLSEPLLLVPGDRFIIRQFSPVVTIGGGVVLDAFPMKRSKKEVRCEILDATSSPDKLRALKARIFRRDDEGLTLAQAVAETGDRQEVLIQQLSSLSKDISRTGDRLISTASLDSMKRRVADSVQEFQRRNPLAGGVATETLRESMGIDPQLFEHVVGSLIREQKLISGEGMLHLPGRGIVMKDDETQARNLMEQAFASAGLKVPALKEVLSGVKIDQQRAQKILVLLLREKVLLKVADELVFHQAALADLRQKLKSEKAKSPKIDVAKFKDLAGVSRKYAIPLLEYLDRERVTKRVGDERIIL